MDNQISIGDQNLINIRHPIYLVFHQNNEKYLKQYKHEYFIETLSDETKKVKFYSKASTGDSYYPEQSSYYEKDLKPKIKKTTTLDLIKDKNNIPSPDLIKIDVEGHEEAVLNGSKDTIRRNQPSFIIEIEERHKIGSIEKIFTFLRKLDYKGFFFIDNKLVSIDEFERDKYQNKKNVAGSRAIGVYLNNFVFVHSKKLFRINSLIK